jgi:hypothetical protein
MMFCVDCGKGGGTTSGPFLMEGTSLCREHMLARVKPKKATKKAKKTDVKWGDT